jgi:NitT/TauT family transport system permease protein
MIRGTIPKAQTIILGIVSVAFLVGLYAWLSHRQHVKNPADTTMPGWTQIKEGVSNAVNPNPRSGERWLVVDSLATLKRLLLGLLAGVGGGIVAGIFMGCFPRIEALLYPPLSFFAKIPPTAALAVFFVMVGTETEMYIAMIAFGILPVLAQSVYLAVKEIPEELLNKASTLGASRPELIWNVVTRIVLPNILDAVRLQIGPAMVYLIAAEMVCGDVGFGYRIRLQSRLLNMNVVYPYLATLAVFGFLMDYALRKIQNLSCPWFAGRSG